MKFDNSILLNDNFCHILFVSEDNLISNNFQKHLNEKGFRVSISTDIFNIRKKILCINFDFFLIDIIRSENFFFLWKRLFSRERTPPFLLLARREQNNFFLSACEGLFSFNCLAKPFDDRELVLRIRNILGNRPVVRKKSKITFGSCIFCMYNRQLIQNGQLVPLTRREQEILAILSERPGEKISRYELLSKNPGVSERVVDVQINALRRKIESDPSRPVWLRTIHGEGYCLEARTMK